MEEKDILDEISKETIRRHQLRRKEQIQKILWDSSFHPNQVAQEKLDKYLGREEKEHIQTENDNMIQLEEQKEELEVCGYPYPNKFRHKRKKTSRKRCWVLQVLWPYKELISTNKMFLLWKSRTQKKPVLEEKTKLCIQCPEG